MSRNIIGGEWASQAPSPTGWKARQNRAIQRKEQHSEEMKNIALRRPMHERDAARNLYSVAVEHRDKIASQFKAKAGLLDVYRRKAMTPYITREERRTMAVLLDFEKAAPTAMAEAEAAVDRARSALHDAQARLDAHQAAAAADERGDAEPEPEPEPEPIQVAPRGRGRPPKAVAP